MTSLILWNLRNNLSFTQPPLTARWFLSAPCKHIKAKSDCGSSSLTVWIHSSSVSGGPAGFPRILLSVPPQTEGKPRGRATDWFCFQRDAWKKRVSGVVRELSGKLNMTAPVKGKTQLKCKGASVEECSTNEDHCPFSNSHHRIIQCISECIQSVSILTVQVYDCPLESSLPAHLRLIKNFWILDNKGKWAGNTGANHDKC